MFEKSLTSFRNLLDYFINIANIDIDYASVKIKSIKFPKLSVQFILELIQIATEIFKMEPTILTVPAQTCVVGDIHGHILDLFRVLREFKPPPLHNYLFLGDFVDRGEFSLETMVLVLLLKILHPSRVFVIRGNHEFSEMCNFCGFMREIEMVYGANSGVGRAFIECFSWMPLAASINGHFLCVHGGIGEDFIHITQLFSIRRPIYGFESEVCADLLWSDPNPEEDNIVPSSRGLGSFFGLTALKEFLRNNNHQVLLRGHQCVESGVEELFDGLMYTVFTASRYCDTVDNKAGVLIIKQDNSVEVHTFSPYTYLRRSEVQFVPVSFKSVSIEAPISPVVGKLIIKPERKESQSSPDLPAITKANHPKVRRLTSTARASSSHMRLFEISINRPIDSSRETLRSLSSRKVRESDASSCSARRLTPKQRNNY